MLSPVFANEGPSPLNQTGDFVAGFNRATLDLNLGFPEKSPANAHLRFLNGWYLVNGTSVFPHCQCF